MSRTANLDPDTLPRRLGNRREVRRARQQARQGKGRSTSDRRAGGDASRAAGASRRSKPEKKTKGRAGAPKRKASRTCPSVRFRNTIGRVWAWWSGRAARRKTPARVGPSRAQRAALGVRQRVVELVLGMLGLVLLGRAGQLQLFEGARYGAVATLQANVVQPVQAKRGTIFDRHRQPLAVSVDVDSVFAQPRRIEDPGRAARALAPVLRLSARRIRARLDSDRPFTYLVRRVDPAVASRVRQLEIEGVGTHPEPKRYYANTELAAHVLGFVNIDGQGRSGVEKTFDRILRGGRASISAIRDGIGNRALTDGYVPPTDLAGRALVLTLDRQIQDAAESELQKAVQTYEARAGVAVVMDVPSGDLLALASWPTFNPNNLAATDPDQQLNRALSAVYEPGSTMKVVTLAAALETGLFRPRDQIDCEDGSWRFGGRTIRDGNHRYGKLSLTDVLRVSSNICSAKVGVELGKKRLHRWLVRFGLSEPTGVELPGELDGLLRDPSQWSDIGLANIAFGQGLAVTPLQLVRAIGAVANDGLMVSPRAVRGVIEGDRLRPFRRPEPQRVISRKTARTVRRMMETVVESGTAQRARIEGVSVAGKTGTAQKVDPKTRRYADDRYVASFVGIVPADDPQFVGLVLLDEPRKNHHGGVVAAPAFRRIAKVALHARGRVMAEGAAGSADPAAVPVPLPAERRRTDDRPTASDPVLAAGDLSPQARRLLGLELPPETGEAESMPDLTGLELREVLKRCREAKCAPDVRGTGRVVKQSPAAGAAVPPGATWRLTLAPR